MKKFAILFFLIFYIALISAHQPRYIMETFSAEDSPIRIQNPEVSQAFYGELKNQPDFYLISSQNPLNLYVSIVVPDNGRTDFNVHISDMILLYGSNFSWQPFYEEFAGDNYLSGPEFEKQVPAGNYLIKVFNANNSGKYSLATGKLEQFSAKDILILPKIKKNFFNKGYIASFQGIIGNIALGALILLVLLISLIILLIKRRK